MYMYMYIQTVHVHYVVSYVFTLSLFSPSHVSYHLSFSPHTVDNVQSLDETIQHNLLLGMRPMSVPARHQQQFDWTPGRVSFLKKP